LDVDHGNVGLAGQRWDCIKGGGQAWEGLGKGTFRLFPKEQFELEGCNSWFTYRIP
jgi:hypothetical protein